MSKFETELRVKAAQLFGYANVAVLRKDVDMALKVCRDLVALNHAYELTKKHGTKPSEEAERMSSGLAQGKFAGRAVKTRYGGKCHVCGDSFGAGATVLLGGGKFAHLNCGVAVKS